MRDFYMKQLLIFVFVLLSCNTFALEIDEKLTLRTLRLSKTKKTMLINRGLEDGLVVGDHAKFFLTGGVIARGVVVKASPTRTIWSVYRIIDIEQLNEDSVMNLKISTPLKLTDDRSKAFRGNVYGGLEEGMTIPLAKGADDLGSQLTDEERKDLENLGGTPPAPVYTQYNVGVDINRTLELWATMHLASSSTSSDDGTGTSNSGSNTSIDLSAGIEKYFTSRESLIGKFSLFALLHNENKEVTTVQGIKSSISVIEAGIGMNYHFFAHPLSYGRVIGYVGGSVGIGQVTDTLYADENNSTITNVPDPISGGSTFVSLALGFKYFLSQGFGGRIALDYYTRSERYVFDTGADTTKTVAGPRVQFGFSYRF